MSEVHISGYCDPKFKEVEKFFDTMPQLKHVAKYTCNTCGEEKETTIQGLDSFFGSA